VTDLAFAFDHDYDGRQHHYSHRVRHPRWRAGGSAPAPQRGDFVRVDLTDYGQAVEALSAVDDRYRGLDAVVHLAAIPAPGLTTNAATFSNNMARPRPRT